MTWTIPGLAGTVKVSQEKLVLVSQYKVKGGLDARQP